MARNYLFLPRHLALQLGAEQPESAYFLMKDRKQSKISTFYTNMGVGVGGRGETKPEWRGREGEMGVACLCVHVEQIAMSLRANIRSRNKYGVFLSSDIRKRKGNEGS